MERLRICSQRKYPETFFFSSSSCFLLFQLSLKLSDDKKNTMEILKFCIKAIRKIGQKSSRKFEPVTLQKLKTKKYLRNLEKYS